MLTFIPVTPALSQTPIHRLRHLKHLSPPQTVCRRHLPPRMLANPRSKEFFLNDNPESDNSPNSQQPSDTIDWTNWDKSQAKITLPALPFPAEQVFLPGETKRLHLFEARYLALFEQVLVHCDKRCAHFLVDFNRHAMATFGVIIEVNSWRRLDIGVSLDIQAVGRLKSCRIPSSTPYFRGEFQSVQDHPLTDPDQILTARKLLERFWPAFRNVVLFNLKLGQDPIREKVDTASESIDAVQKGKGIRTDSQFQSLTGENDMFKLSMSAEQEFFEHKLKQAARRAINFPSLDLVEEHPDDDMVARQALALSFAGWDFFPSHFKLRQRAIEEFDTLARLTNVVAGLEEHRKELAAKLALRSAFRE